MDLLSRIRFEIVSDALNDYKTYQIKNADNNMKFDLLKILKEFESKNFADNNMKDIESLCAKMNIVYSSLLKIEPSKVEYLPWTATTYMATFNDRNYIQISDTFLEDFKKNKINRLRGDQIGLFYLYGILHETYHTYQNYNLFKYANEQNYDEKVLINYYQSMITNFNVRGYTFNQQRIFYSTDLLEYQANMFAMNKMIELLEKGYIDKNRGYEFLNLQCKYYLENPLSKENINFTKYVYNLNLEQFKKIEQLKDDDINVSNVKALKKISREVQSLNFDELYKNALKEIEKLKEKIKQNENINQEIN